MRKDEYIIADGIYTTWVILGRLIHYTLCKSETRYTKLQEALRMDIERYFGVLQAIFQILRKERHYWDDSFILSIRGVRVTLRNMLVRMNQYRNFGK